MGRTVTFAALGIVIAVAVWLGASLMSSSYCSQWNPFSCHGADPELTKLIQ